MKVLFAVSNESISEAIIKRYPKEYREILSYKNVYYFNAILKEIQKDKTYDRIVISEDLEPFVNANNDSIDNFIYEHLDKISDEAQGTNGKETSIILICSERRSPGSSILNKLFSIGVYNALLGKDRNLKELCALINKPRTKKEAKIYYRIDQVSYDPASEIGEVNEVEIQNILNHFKKLGKNTERYASSFNNIASQYTDEQLKIIVNILPIKVKAVLETECEKYRELMGNGGVIRNSASEELEPGISINTIGKSSNINGPIVIPAGVRRASGNIVSQTHNAVRGQVQAGQQENRVSAEPVKNVVRVQRPTNSVVTPNPAPRAQNPNTQVNTQNTQMGAQQTQVRPQVQPQVRPQIQPQVNQVQKQVVPKQEPVNNVPPKVQSNNIQVNNGENVNQMNTDLNSMLNNITGTTENSLGDSAQEKRGRGRPRKVVVEPPKPKGKRGRPRKNPVELQDENAIPSLENISTNEPAEVNNLIEDVPLPDLNNSVEEVSLPGLDDVSEEVNIPGLDDLQDNSLADNSANDDISLPGLEDIADDMSLPGLDDVSDSTLPGLDDTNEEATLPGLDDISDSTLPGLDNTNNEVTLPGLDDFSDNTLIGMDDGMLPGLDDDFDFSLPGTEEPLNNNANNNINTSTDDVDVTSLLAGLDEENQPQINNEESILPGLDNNVEETILPGMGFEDTVDNNIPTNPVSNPNPVQNQPSAIESIKPKVDYSMSNLNSLLSKDKKIVTFLGTTKNGTSFLVNNLAVMFSMMGIDTAILDMTKNRNSYYIFTDSREELRKIAYTSISKLENGYAEGIKANKNLTVYTALPADGTTYENAEPILSTLVQNHSLVLIDCDFDTPPAYFASCQEIYLVQSMDILTIQPLTEFLRGLKFKGVWEPEKVRVVINKELDVRGLNNRMVIGGMSRYNGPDMSVMTDLFNKDMVKACSIPFDEKVYSKYLETMATCKLSLSGYSKQFMSKLQILGEMVYPRLNSKKTYNPGEMNNTRNVFSNNTNNTLNAMKNKF